MADADWHWGISNPGPTGLLIWLEPWAEEFAVPVRSNLTMKVRNSRPGGAPLEIEDGGEHIVVWANGGDTIEIYVAGAFQDSGSATLEVPDVFATSTREFLSIAFANAPAARLGGRETSAPPSSSLWRKLKHKLRDWF